MARQEADRGEPAGGHIHDVKERGRLPPGRRAVSGAGGERQSQAQATREV
jgi:hypothetical protein